MVVDISKPSTKFTTIVHDVRFTMLRNTTTCWIKATPLHRVATPLSISIILNGNKHHFDIYDASGHEAHEVYFIGNQCTPRFFLMSKDHRWRIDCDTNNINIHTISGTHMIDTYLQNHCSCNSPQASCWALAIYATTRRQQPPFDEM